MALPEANRDEVTTGRSQTADNWHKLNHLLVAALELDPSDRQEFLRKECAGDARLLVDAESMLGAIGHIESRGFLAEDAFAVGARVLAEEQRPPAIPEQIGPYKIVKELGRGGMGAVLLGERSDPRQLVAIKIIKRGMDTDEIIGRFRRERQFLAALNHPNIAILLDAATTEDGLPYFVMEYVQGVPITEYSDSLRLGINDRLRLFQKICAAVACCHRNLIVHRDIKPSNILVTEDGQPKLMDFGIAKLLAAEDLEVTVEQTVANARLFTPDYASPEQVHGEKITTASDIYSLGIVLYELLSGHRPGRLRQRSSGEGQELNSRKEPIAPSIALLMKTGSSKALTPETVASSRSERLSILRRRLSGDLDNITLKALRNEPERRYQTVEQLSDDIRRHLSGLPVLARPDSFRYRATKFAGRNRLAVALTSLLLLALGGVIVATLLGSIRAERNRALAQQRASETRRLANSLLIEFDAELENLAGSYPTRIKLAKASSDYLDSLAQQTNEAEVMKELVTAHLRLARVYGNGLSDEAQAQKHWRQAEQLARQLLVLAPNDLATKELLASSLASEGFRGSKPAREEALKLRLEIASRMPNDSLALDNLAESHVDLASILFEVGQKKEGLEHHTRAIDARRRVILLLDRPNLSAFEYNTKFWNHLWTGLELSNQFNDTTAAFDHCYKALEIGKQAVASFPDDKQSHTNIQAAHTFLARVYLKTRDNREALTQYQMALRSAREVNRRFNLFGLPGEARYLLRIGDVFLKLGDRPQAFSALEETLTLRREASKIDHANPRTKHMHPDVFREVGDLYASAGEFDRALAVYLEVEQSWFNSLDAEPSQSALHFYAAQFAVLIGDLYAGSSAGGSETKETNPVRLRLAYDWYRKGSERLARQPATSGGSAYARLVSEKLDSVSAKLR